jgi:hypothetical protein
MFDEHVHYRLADFELVSTARRLFVRFGSDHCLRLVVRLLRNDRAPGFV